MPEPSKILNDGETRLALYFQSAITVPLRDDARSAAGGWRILLDLDLSYSES